MAITQAEIAKLAGVSRATVDRVVNQRGKVNAEVEAKILKIMRENHYKKNTIGSRLVKSNRSIRIGVVIQSRDTIFMSELIDDLKAAEPGLGRNLDLQLKIRAYDGIDLKQQLDALNELEKEGVDGIALTPVEDIAVSHKIDELHSKGIPVVTLNTDIPFSKRLCYVGQDATLSGRACANLMNLMLPNGGDVLMIAGNYSNLSQRRRLEGFQSESHMLYKKLHLLPIENGNDTYESSYEAALRALKRFPEIRGIYIAANGQTGVCDALRELKCRDRVRFICHDLTKPNIACLREGMIDFVIGQDAQMQATTPIRILINFLLDGTLPESEYQMTKIDIRTAYNI
jgi:LacI family transcriptional regulator